jgi:S-DNA-T family DNA segregation ATPase FtsK/SpoIIIE
VFILGLQRFKKLRREDDFSFSSGDAKPKPDEDLGTLIQEGSAVGIHLVIHCDTFNNVNRYLSRKALSEFELRVAFQMSANDSASLIDTPKASALGMNRALLHNEQEGTQETFRPYALPDPDWFA